MKYSRTESPSMKLLLIGRSMISPFGLAMQPRMPASWRICLNDPRAPELAIMKMGFRRNRCSCMASATSSVASSHRFTTRSCRSSAVMRPSAKKSSNLCTSASYLARISGFSGGITTSFFEIVMPDWLA